MFSKEKLPYAQKEFMLELLPHKMYGGAHTSFWYTICLPKIFFSLRGFRILMKNFLMYFSLFKRKMMLKTSQAL